MRATCTRGGLLAAAGAAALARPSLPGALAAKPLREVSLRAAPETVELGRRRARTWTYGGLPGPELRVRQGERLRVRLENGLPQPTTVHWHGIRLPNAMDGVPGLTQRPVPPGGSFVYEFAPPDAGTYIFHSHVGLQLDRGLYGALVVEPRAEPLAYDREAVLVLDDWLDGLAGTPEARFARLRRRGMTMGGMRMGGGGGMQMGGGGMQMGGGGMQMGGRGHTTLGGGRPGPDDLAFLANRLERGQDDPGDVTYPLYLVNGRPPEDPYPLGVRRGDRLRLRLINVAADTVFCFFVEGHRLTIVHADGQPVEPVRTDAVVLGMGERYDVLVEARRPGAHRMVAMPLGKRGHAAALLRYAGTRERPPAPDAPLSMPPRIASYTDLRDAAGGGAVRDPRPLRLDLGLVRGRYVWTIGGRPFARAEPIRARRGEALRLVLRNRTSMPHPMHLHGHFFRPSGAGGRGPLKDTILVLPRREQAVELVADNPGRWAFHCHNAYHQEAGMMRALHVA